MNDLISPPPAMRLLRLLRDACFDMAMEKRPDYDVSPLEGCCGAVSVMVQRMFGGEIMGGDVVGRPHFWNRLPCGTEVDLTSCQFGGDGWTPIITGIEHPIPEIAPLEFIAFAADVHERLGRVR